MAACIMFELPGSLLEGQCFQRTVLHTVSKLAATAECPYTPGSSVLLWKYGMENHWVIAHPDHSRPEGISISQEERVAALQNLP
jgi:hypothetical protein